MTVRGWPAARKSNSLDSPISIYEVHLGSWRRVPEEGNRWLTYRELAPLLADYVHDAGFTHVEFLPVMEHPFDGSWGYETTGYFAPTSRFGTPADFMYLVDYLHQRGIGVILDWVPAHFPKDEAGLGYFDGSHLYEHADPQPGRAAGLEHVCLQLRPQRGPELSHQQRAVLAGQVSRRRSSRRCRRLDVVSRLRPARRPVDTEPLWRQGKPRRNSFPESAERARLRGVSRRHDDRGRIDRLAAGVAAHLRRRPRIRSQVEHGLDARRAGLHVAGSGLSQLSPQPDHVQPGLRLRENFVLPFSHDEVVYGKGSMLRKMPGDEWQKFANLRLLYGFMFGHPGKKLLFMGDEFGQWSEWNHDASLEWHLLNEPLHAGLKRWVRDLNTLYRGEPSLHELDFDPAGFEWVDCKDSQRSVISFLRRGRNPDDQLLFVCNFTPVVRQNYRVGVPGKASGRKS